MDATPTSRFGYLRRGLRAVGGAALLLGCAARVAATPAGPLTRSPSAITFVTPEASQQLLVSAGGADVTSRAAYRSLDPGIAAVEPGGVVRPRADGATRVRISYAGQRADVRIQVRAAHPGPVSFQQDVIPVLTRAGCNAGRCHGKAEGQHGFRLTVFSYDPEADHRAIRTEGGGRRVQVTAPARSLLLLKATGALPHGGGRRVAPGSAAYRLLARWIAEGARFDRDAPPPQRLVVEPAGAVLQPRQAQQLRVTTVTAGGARRCVTGLAAFKSSEAGIAEVDERGIARSAGPAGEAAVLVRYLNLVAVCRISIPRPGPRPPAPPPDQWIDGHVAARLHRLGIPSSPVTGDAVFLRRVYLDVIGTLPTAAEARDFLAECDGERGAGVARPAPRARARLIDRLLARPEYADYWASRWADLLRVDGRAVTQPGAFAMHRWLRRQFAENRPFDAFARDILTAQGNLAGESPAAFYKALEKPDVMSRSVSQLFLGVRIECAQCHQHPSERWSQADYYALAGFFTGVSFKKAGEGEAVLSAGGANLTHPRTGAPVPAAALGAPPAAFPEGEDRRTVLAAWLTGADNPYFARTIVNRLWSHYFGRGLVEPVDDMRVTNPATNEPLLAALAEHLRGLKYDLKRFTRTLLNTRTYQLAGALPANADDAQGYSHASPRSIPAEVLLDALCQATGAGEVFEGWPPGYRAIQVWDSRLPSFFLRIFGRPLRNSVCECERSGEPSIAQALHLMNSPEIGEKIHARDGTARRLATSQLAPEQIVDELFLGCLTRFPTTAERQVMLKLFAESGSDRVAATEDVLWSLLNSRDFVFNR